MPDSVKAMQHGCGTTRVQAGWTADVKRGALRDSSGAKSHERHGREPRNVRVEERPREDGGWRRARVRPGRHIDAIQEILSRECASEGGLAGVDGGRKGSGRAETATRRASQAAAASPLSCASAASQRLVLRLALTPSPQGTFPVTPSPRSTVAAPPSGVDPRLAKSSVRSRPSHARPGPDRAADADCDALSAGLPRSHPPIPAPRPLCAARLCVADSTDSPSGPLSRARARSFCAQQTGRSSNRL